jgi:hypothetical protein
MWYYLISQQVWFWNSFAYWWCCTIFTDIFHVVASSLCDINRPINRNKIWTWVKWKQEMICKLIMWNYLINKQVWSWDSFAYWWCCNIFTVIYHAVVNSLCDINRPINRNKIWTCAIWKQEMICKLIIWTYWSD